MKVEDTIAFMGSLMIFIGGKVSHRNKYTEGINMSCFHIVDLLIWLDEKWFYAKKFVGYPYPREASCHAAPGSLDHFNY